MNFYNKLFVSQKRKAQCTDQISGAETDLVLNVITTPGNSKIKKAIIRWLF